MSTFKQIVEGYAGNVSGQHSEIDYEGASNRATSKMHTDEAIEQLHHHLTTYGRLRHVADISPAEANSASRFKDSFAKVVANPTTDEHSLGRLFIVMSNIDHNYSGDRISRLIDPFRKIREIANHPNAGEYIKGMVAMHNGRR